jgi:hypothetical protein
MGRTSMRSATRLALSLLLAAACPAAGATTVSASEAASSSQIYLVQGVPGAAVDVSIDGSVVARDLAAKEIAGPFDLSGGSHTVSFESASWTADTSVSAGRPSIDVVVHRPASPGGDPVVTVFGNAVGPIAPGTGRVTVAHTAVVPPADVRASGEVLFANIANGEFVTAEVPADTYSIDLVPTGGGSPLLGPVDLPVEGGALTRVFAIGMPENGSMDAIVQVLPLPERTGPPGSVDAGLVGPVTPTADHPALGQGPWRQGLALVLVLAGVGVLLSVPRVSAVRGGRHAAR